MRKHFISLALCGVLAAGSVAGLVGCGGGNGGNSGYNGDGGTYSLTLWGPNEQQATLQEMVNRFKQKYSGNTYNITIGVCGEGDAYANVSKDPFAAADVYAYANDQIVNLVNCGGLAQVGGDYAKGVRENNVASAVEAATFKDRIYGYPYAADNGYFLYYDKSVVTEEQAATLEGIIAACETANKKIAWSIDDAWYVAGWLFAFGGEYEVEYNTDGSEKSVDCNFNTSAGIKASKAMSKLTSSTAFAGKGTNNDTISAGFGDGSVAVAVTGTWMAEAIESALGENYGVCKLPTVTVDGETKQLSSFAGCKLYGVNAASANLAEAHRLAEFLASEEMQQLRFTNHKIGPSNKVVAESDAVKANAALAALANQNKYAVAQQAVPANFWDPVKAYGIAIIDGLAESEYQAKLDAMTALVKGTAGQA